MRFFAGAAFVMLAVSGPAMGADMPLKAPVAAPVPYSWTGCYVGGNVGWKNGRFNESVSTPAYTSPFQTLPLPADSSNLGTTTGDSVVGGGQVGCQWQVPNNLVFGIEGDFDGQNLQVTATQGALGTATTTLTRGATRTGFSGTLLTGDNYTEKARWQSSIRGTFGYAFNRLLVYGTGGVAFTNVSVSGSFPSFVNEAQVFFPGSSGSDSHVLVGATFGGGLTYAMDNHWQVGTEYKYSTYGSKNFSTGSVAGSCNTTTCVYVPTTKSVGLSTNEVLAKVNYKF